MTQPGYDTLADQYAETFPQPFTSPLERPAVDAFAATLALRTDRPRVIDVGCGTGHVTAYLAERVAGIVGVDPSAEMLRFARAAYPELAFEVGDAALAGHDLGAVDGLLARFSLIHLPPDRVRAVLTDWHSRLPTGATILIAAQSADEPGVHEFDHRVARAWRWHADTLAEAARAAGFTELWRTVARPGTATHHRFPELHLAAEAAPSGSLQ